VRTQFTEQQLQPCPPIRHCTVYSCNYGSLYMCGWHVIWWTTVYYL